MELKLNLKSLKKESDFPTDAANQLDQNKTENISKIYSETFVKLFITKGACCDWYQYEWLVEHLKYILLL